MNTKLRETAQEMKNDRIFGTWFLGLGGLLFLLVGIFSGFTGAGASDGLIPAVLGAAFLAVMGIYRFHAEPEANAEA